MEQFRFYWSHISSHPAHDIIEIFPNRKQKYFLKSFKKVVFGRDPFEKLLSAYRDKMAKPPVSIWNWYRHFSQTIIRQYRQGRKEYLPVSESELKNGVSFLEFVKYYTDPITIPKGYESQNDTITHLCEPCRVNYEFIGK